MKLMLILLLILFVARFCTADSAEHPYPQTPDGAPRDSIGALIYMLCHEDLAIVWVIKSEDGASVITEMVRGPAIDQMKQRLATLREFEKNGGPVHEVELDQSCVRT